MNRLAHLSNIRIIMVGTTLPANIGSAARAMHTMGLSDLVVVNPRLPIDETSHAHAAGATTILDKARIANSIDEAVADCSLILAASARTRHLPRPTITPQQGAKVLANFFDTHTIHANSEQNTTIGILFGREDRGLTNDELALADYHIQIPANPAYPVLNVASAIQVIASFIYHDFSQSPSDDVHDDTTNDGFYLTIRQDWDEPAITHTQKTKLNNRIISLMCRLGLADTHDLKNLPNRLSRMNSRIQLDQKEYALLSALLAKIEQKLH
ncbi:RNA methyltransferase [Moraxella haemolytica]|uniref:RNA methyltransferase n=1 Tax=Moraxella haemolytica TaxID=2904119 RepID=UPI00254325CC|nr:RNA methyltransferase [Moraxella sp. ZY171148]WII95922.1 RNA methyltransferase [Moraxella sp. ZY171148]